MSKNENISKLTELARAFSSEPTLARLTDLAQEVFSQASSTGNFYTIPLTIESYLKLMESIDPMDTKSWQRMELVYYTLLKSVLSLRFHPKDDPNVNLGTIAEAGSLVSTLNYRIITIINEGEVIHSQKDILICTNTYQAGTFEAMNRTYKDFSVALEHYRSPNIVTAGE